MAAYPHKSTVAIFLSCVIVVGGFYYYVFHIKNRPVAAEKASVAIDTQAVVPDKLPETDWQKEFLDKNISSSAYKAPEAPKKTDAAEKNTATYALGKNFLTQYITLRQNGLNTDEEVVSNSMDRAVEQSGGALPPARVYSSKDIAVVPDSSSSEKSYSRTISLMSAKYDSRVDEADLALRAYEVNDLSELARLDTAIAGYKSILSSLSATAVPQSYLDQHLVLMNSLSLLLYSSQAFRKMEDDPLTALAAIKADAYATQAADKMFDILRARLSAKGLSINL